MKKKIIHIFRRMKLQSKIQFTYLIVCTVPILIVGVFAYLQANRQIEETEIAKVNAALLHAKYNFENKISLYENYGGNLALNETIYQVINYRGSDANKYETYQRYTTFIDPLILPGKYLDGSMRQISIYTSKVMEPYGTTLLPINSIKSKEIYGKIGRNSSALWFVEKDKSVTYIQRMLTKTYLDAESLLFFDINYDKFFQPISTIEEENIGIIIEDKNGEVIFTYHSFLPQYAKYELNSTEGLSDGRTSIQSVQYHIGIQEVEQAGFVIYLYKPIKSIPRYADRILLTVLIVILASLIIMYGVGTGVSYLIVKPIKSLTKNMAMVADGKMEVNVTSDLEDEVGIMIRSFGIMVERISTLINENYKTQISLKEYEMIALQAQINPHFLYNSLSLINWKALRAGEKDISKISLLLASFYRTTLNKGKSMTIVREEIKNIEAYLEIQLFMHDHSFDITKEISDDILDVSMPNLILQPIVENAIHHGIDLLEDRKGMLTIRGFSADGYIVLQVEDNGVGIDGETCEKLLTIQSSGYGVRNVNERIMLLYGECYHIEVTSELDVGTIVTVRIPYSMGENE